MQRWYLIHTKPAGEGEAQLHLQRQGYPTYCPRLLQTVRRRGHPRVQIAPLFPRYLFLQLDEGRQSLTPARSTSGVAAVVRFGSRFATVPDEIVAELRAREDPTSGLHQLRAAPAFTPGTPVRIADGALAGLEGVFQRPDGLARVVVLLQLLGEQREVYFPSELVSAA